MKKKLILINPIDRRFHNLADTEERKFPPLALGILAALTPDTWDIEIIDENFDLFSYKPADLVGITAFTCNAAKAYSIAAIYREHHTHTVLGGIHASVMPDEASQYVDTVVVGEGENVWGKLINDFENNCIKKIYKEPHHTLINLPKPRRDLFDKRYKQTVLQTSRGCPFHCDYCSISVIFGNTYRYRPVNEVLDEMESITQNSIFIIDDNLFLNCKKSQERNKELFEGIIKRKIKKCWNTFAATDCIENQELLKLAAESGCTTLYIGFESEDENTLKQINKKINLKYARDNYKELIRTIHKYGISIMGGIIFGFDTDNIHLLKKRANFAANSLIDTLNVNIFTPLPGTELYKRIKNENRLLYEEKPINWSKYSYSDLVFVPKNMSVNDFNTFMKKTYNRLFCKFYMALRFIRILIDTRNKKLARRGYRANKAVADSYL